MLIECVISIVDTRLYHYCYGVYFLSTLRSLFFLTAVYFLSSLFFLSQPASSESFSQPSSFPLAPTAAEAVTPSQPSVVSTCTALIPYVAPLPYVTPLSSPAPLPYVALLSSPAPLPYVAPLSSPTNSFPSDSGPDLSCIASYALRNPQMVTQERRVHDKQSDAQKATAELRRQAEHEKQDLLATDLSAFLERQRVEIEDIAEKHATTVEHIEKLLNFTPHYRRKVRAVNIENAKIHAKGEEVNASKF